MLVVLAVALMAALSAPAWAQEAPIETGGVLVRVDGNVTLATNDTVEVLVVIGEDSQARVNGTVGVLVVVGGTLDLNGTVRHQLVLVNAHARLHNGSVVEGDVARTESTIDQDPGARIEGTVDVAQPFRFVPVVAFVFGTIFIVGVPLALLLAGFLAVAVFPRQLHTVGHHMTAAPGPTAVGAAVVFLLLPIVAFLLFFTLVGIPTAFGLLFVVLPFLWTAGYIAAGHRLGEALFTRRSVARRDRPYLGMLAGLGILLVASAVPAIGGSVALLAGAWGGGAVTHAAWQAARAHRRQGPPARGRTRRRAPR